MEHIQRQKPRLSTVESSFRDRGDTAVATFNLYNFFAPPSDVKLAKLVLALRFVLALPDILVVQETGSEAALQLWADVVNKAAGTRYRALAPPCSDRRGIRVGFLWDQARVELAAGFQMAGTAVTQAFGPASPNPGREPLVGIFHLRGRELVILANHFKSDHVPEEQTAVSAQLRQASYRQRQTQAHVVRDYVNQYLAGQPQANLIVTGDFNQTFPSADDDSDHPFNILSGRPDEPPLTNLLPRFTNPPHYTFLRDGQQVTLDHIFVSPALLPQVTAVNVLHFNAASPPEAEGDPATAARVSDHDPLEVRFTFPDKT